MSGSCVMQWCSSLTEHDRYLLLPDNVICFDTLSYDVSGWANGWERRRRRGPIRRWVWGVWVGGADEGPCVVNGAAWHWCHWWVSCVMVQGSYIPVDCSPKYTAPARFHYSHRSTGVIQPVKVMINNKHQSQIKDDIANPLCLPETQSQNIPAKVVWTDNCPDPNITVSVSICSPCSVLTVAKGSRLVGSRWEECCHPILRLKPTSVLPVSLV